MCFEYHQDGRHVKKITVGSAAYEFEYCERAEGDMIAKSHAADKSCRLLAKIKYPDKSEDTFSYMRTPGTERRILLENFSSETVKTNANRMTQKNAAGAESWVEWCESTGIIMADSGGKYSVGNDRLDSEHPRANPNAATPSYITLQYAPYKGGNRELFHYNWMKLEEIKGGAGGIFRYVKMAAKGTNYLNDRRVEKLRPGSSLNSSPQWDLQKLCHYDQFGRIIRSIDAAGDITEWKYFTDSQELEKKTENGRLVYLKTLKDNGDSEETEWRKGSVEKSIHLAAKNATVKISEENGLRYLRYYKDNQLISSKTEEIK